MRVAVIGGTGLRSWGGEALRVDTPFGAVEAQVGKLAGREVWFLARHGPSHVVPPHKINVKANVDAAARAGCERVLAVNTVGSMKRELLPGSLAVARDYIDLSGRAATFFDDEVVHIDSSEPYCPEVRRALREAAGGAPEVVYACTQGPRLETPAEIRMLSGAADVVGMTGYPEVVLARERGLCYGALCVVSNLAAGLQERLTAREVAEASQRAAPRVRSAVEAAVGKLPDARGCACKDALRDARLA
ncbi:MAG TPA: MTAP family purine nucleoside phosphorylase [Candidatus Thermoplasmatota archaeon]|nr:MTAP family purine nucleoside phosphorylase [Candidatus Thermoplasmatota archaeon]